MGWFDFFKCKKMTLMEQHGYMATKYEEGQERLQLCKLCYYSWLDDKSQIKDVKDYCIVAQTLYNLLCFNCADNKDEDINATALAYYFATRTIYKQPKLKLYGVELRIILCNYVKQEIQNLIINMMDEKVPTNKYGGVEYRQFANAANLMIMYYDIMKNPEVLHENLKIAEIKDFIESLIDQGFFSTWCENNHRVTIANMGGSIQAQLYNYIHNYYYKALL